MKRCHKCRRAYTDETLNFCLDDGEWLVDGSVSSEESKTAILHSAEYPGEAATRHQVLATDQTGALPTTVDQPQTHRRVRARFVLTAGLAVVVAVAGLFGYRFFASNSKQINSIAVLPFENDTGDPGMDYLSDGLSEELLNKFSQLPDLKVIARQSSFKYRGPDVDLSEVANKLGVAAVVSGRVTKQGDQLVVRAELIDVRENKQLWGEQYSRKVSDAISIQQEIATSVASSLRPRLTGAQEQRIAKKGTTNPEAYELLLKGKFSTEEGQQFFEQAVAVDPNYAEAWARLAAVYILHVNDGGDPERWLPKAEAAARRALQLDDSLPMAHQAYADWLVTQWKWRDAEAEYRRVIELDQNGAHGSYARLLSFVGRHDEAVREAVRNRELNPVGPFAHNLEGSTLFLARRYDEAIQASQRALDLETWSNFYLTLGNTYAAKKMYREAIEAYLNVANPPDLVWMSKQIHLGAAYANIGERDKALAILKELQTTERYVSPAEIPVLLIALGMKDEAFASFEKAIEEHDPKLGYLKAEPAFDPVRDDPRFADLVRRVALPD